jgi:HD-like signal output (HDOD) protein
MSSPKKFIKQFSKIKTLPNVVTKLSTLIADENSTIKDFEEVIRMDPTLVVRLLRLVNSPFYGLTVHIDSISRAVAFIGVKNLHNMAVTDALKDIFKEERGQTVFSRKQLWLHCAAVGVCSKMIAERIFATNDEDAYLCGILHDFGLIVEEQVANEDFLKVCAACQPGDDITHYEQEYLGTDHCEIGYAMTLDWNMPLAIQEAIRDHHTLSDQTNPEELTGIIQMAEYITSQLGYSALPGKTVRLSRPLVEHMQTNMEEYQVVIDDFPEEMAKAHDLYA